jgi:predicted nucleotidyltransferase
MIDPTIKNNIIKILRQNENIKFAYLFGSQAKNRTRFGSDLDIALYFKSDPSLQDIGVLVFQLEKVSDCKIDLVSLNQLFKTNPKLAYSVIDYGILLFSTDEALLAEYKKLTFLYYLDFKPIIDLFTTNLYERLEKNQFAVAEPHTPLSDSRKKK